MCVRNFGVIIRSFTILLCDSFLKVGRSDLYRLALISIEGSPEVSQGCISILVIYALLLSLEQTDLLHFILDSLEGNI